MDVIALVGPSGTGKPPRADCRAQERADAIIDDGILIKDGKILAAIRQEGAEQDHGCPAGHLHPAGHAEEVRKAIEESQPHCILILGTSENMVQKITRALHLAAHREDHPHRGYHDAVGDGEGRALPRQAGRCHHPCADDRACRISPATHRPAAVVLQALVDELSRRRLGEKSIVRPVFSYYGKLVIDDSAIKGIVRHVISMKARSARSATSRSSTLFAGDEDQPAHLLHVVLTHGNHIPTLLEVSAGESHEPCRVHDGHDRPRGGHRCQDTYVMEEIVPRVRLWGLFRYPEVNPMKEVKPLKKPMAFTISSLVSP